ncbi:hypothetical protein GCK72_025835 [Caenorhabditis remanei]|uniref:Uncharacterized protein n=1 Tax=Caenorhabditis remanei TaxID=31234 RepID=A0A6A5G360_CAERE|nr:hypothetical protein GCK72_025835 [Caenorhabditis remanei]KAF1749367.1 hypothetical protein GCK72_025835 [Caenorhabditis remanei]
MSFRRPFPKVKIPIEDVSEPTDPLGKLLVSEEEIHDFQGKKKCFQTLLAHPRAKDDVLQQPIGILSDYFTAIFQLQNRPYNEEARIQLERSLKRMALLEDLLIRVIVSNESVEHIVADRKQRDIE